MAAAKTQQVPQDNTGTFALAQNQPQISLASSVLASIIPLPQHPLIVYSVFTCLPATSDRLEQLEIARREVWLQNKSKPFAESLLPVVDISKDTSTLYVFALGSTGHTTDAQEALSHLRLETLTLTESSSFTPAAIYPCSAACSTQATPCERCVDVTFAAPPASPVQLLPRSSLRLPLTFFLRAVRDRLIDDVAEASKLHPRGRSVTRFQGGFLLGPLPVSSEWGSGWESYARHRPLISCTLQVYISEIRQAPVRLVVHPVMRPTYYVSLPSSLPLPAGTPIVLLPDGSPAYYLSIYSGPASALTTQFEDALAGLGAGDWKRVIHTFASESTTPQDGPIYIVAWLAVQNRQGEDKGMPVIWPAALCVSYHASSPSPHARSSLPYIPELPAQLQASPPPPVSAIPASLSLTMTASSPSVDAPVSATTSAPPSLADRERLSIAFPRRPSFLRSSLTSDSLRAFRTLTLSKRPYTRDTKKVASEVGTYVDSVVKERERERERIRRERQEQEVASARAKLTSATPQPVVEPPASPPLIKTIFMEDATNAVCEAPSPPADIEAPEPESHLTEESDHSGDSLFSPPDGPMDLPSIDEEPQSAPGPPSENVPAESANVGVSAPVEAEPPTGVFDPFHGFESSWVQQPSAYMDINMEYDMDFNMNIDPLGGTRTSGAGAGSYDVDDGFGVFTEDDFDFFDGPSAQRGSVNSILPTVAGLGTALTPGAGPPSLSLIPLVPTDGPVSGAGPPSTGTTHPSPWITHLTEPFTPRNSVDVHGFMDVVAPPELLPPSPIRTPSSYSAPVTPSVHISDSYKSVEGRYKSSPFIFDPIPFASSHREADGKYVIGKFALPSPPADDIDGVSEPLPVHTPVTRGWKSKYHAATDPRVGMVRMLRGVKRKSVDQGSRECRKPLWESYREPEEWQSSSPPSVSPDSEESDEELWIEDEETTAAPRPSTPPPSYLPLGPTLLQTHFQHAHLLPKCTPLRPPGVTVTSTPGNTAPIFAPTPVSPAAVLGAASEKSKSLEAAAQVLVKEVVENPVWAEAWRANASLSSPPPALPPHVWQADARHISLLIGSRVSEPPVELQALFGEVSAQSGAGLYPLNSPMLAIGKGEAVIQVSPASLRFWEKLGLSPRSGPKDVTAFVFYEGADEEREAEMEGWLERVSAAYSAKNLGAHVAGITSEFTKRGLAPTRFDTLRKTLTSFVSTIPEQNRNPHLVFYIATPSHMISSSSTTLRQILSAVRRFYKSHPGGDVLVHFVPHSLICGTHIHPASSLYGLDTFVCSVYDRILQPVNRAMSRKFFAHSAPVVGFFNAPAYALSPTKSTGYPRVSFSLESTISSLDVMNRHLLLHVGYELSTCGRWILAACVDAEGEAHDLRAWLTPDDRVEDFVVKQVWSFIYEFARRANIEWRIIIAKLGLMSHSEVDAWASHLDSVVTTSADVPPVHVTLLCVDTDNPWTFLSSTTETASSDIMKRSSSAASSQMPLNKSSSRHTHTTFSDASCTTYTLSSPPGFTMYPAYTADRNAKCLSTTVPGSLDPPFIPDMEDEDGNSISVQSLPVEAMRIPGWSTVVCAPSISDHTSVSTIHVFQLHITHSLRSTYGISGAGSGDDVDQSEFISASISQQVQAEHTSDIIRNYHELAVLSRARWKLRGGPALPFHLAALEVMRTALSGGAVEP